LIRYSIRLQSDCLGFSLNPQLSTLNYLAGVLSVATFFSKIIPVLVGDAGLVLTDEFRRKLRLLRSLCQDIVELRRGVHSGARLNLDQERLEREQEKTEEEVVEHFKRWMKNPEVRDLICQDWVSPEERERRMREIFGLAPKTPDEAATNGPESSPVKPNQTESNQIKPDENTISQPAGRTFDQSPAEPGLELR
jgi:hypothetical protein